MRLILIRHGDPDYKNDCLTELGKKQAAAVAQRLKDENIDVIYASTVGRATETATYTAELLNKKIIPLEFVGLRYPSKPRLKPILFPPFCVGET